MRRPQVVLGTCALALFLVTMDVTIINVALPAIHDAFDASLASIQWAVDGYNVAMASIMLFAGSMADRFGRKRIFLAGVTTFGLASLACTLAPSIEVLVICRIVQALGGSVLTPSAMGIVVNTFTDPRERAKAIGTWGMMTGFSMAAGPLVGGFLTQTLGWRWIFAINVPIVAIAIALTLAFVGESRAPHARRFDPVGQLLAIATLGLFVWALIEGRASHWGAGAIVALAGAIVALVALIPYELRRREPLIELHFFRSLPFSSASAIAVFGFTAFNSFLFVAMFYLQDSRGLTPFAAGLYLVPAAVVMMICAPLAARMAGAGRASLSFTLSGAALTLGTLLLFGLSRDMSVAQMMAGFVLFGAGLGLANAAITNTAVSGMPREQAGVAVGIASAFRVVGSALGVAVAGTPQVFSWWIPLACGVAVLALGANLMRARSAEPNAAFAR